MTKSCMILSGTWLTKSCRLNRPLQYKKSAFPAREDVYFALREYASSDSDINVSVSLLYVLDYPATHISYRSHNHLNHLSKGAKIRNRYNQVPHLTQDTNGKVVNSQLDATNESQEVSPFPAGDHKAHINRRAQRQSKANTRQNKNIKDPQKKYRL